VYKKYFESYNIVDFCSDDRFRKEKPRWRVGDKYFKDDDGGKHKYWKMWK
jgi:hypothetical protein